MKDEDELLLEWSVLKTTDPLEVHRGTSRAHDMSAMLQAARQISAIPARPISTSLRVQHHIPNPSHGAHGRTVC